MPASRKDDSDVRRRVRDATVLGVTAFTGLSRLQEEVARAASKFIVFERLEPIYELKPGTISRWMKDEEFKGLVDHLIERDQRYAMTEVDYGRALKPDQKKVARLMVYEVSMTQEELGAAVGVTDRTIRNWLTDPAFLAYIEQLEAQAAKEDEQALKQQDERIRSILRDVRIDAAEKFAEKVRAGDSKAISDVLEGYLRNRK